MRCRPGDLAVFVKAPSHKPQLLGMFVTTLYMPGVGDFYLPDGVLSASNDPENWVVQFQRPLRVPMIGGPRASRMASYAVAPDWALRPIRPDADPVETEAEREVAA